MKHLIRLLILPILVVTLFSFASVRPVQAACLVGDSGLGGTLTVQVFASHNYTLNFYDASGALIFSIPEPFVTDTLFTIPAPPGFRYTLVDNSINCGGGGVTFFTPNDARVNGQPGDRIALYCNSAAKPPTVGVILIDDKGNGFVGVTFDYAKLKAAGKKGLTVTAPGGNQVTAISEGTSNILARWSGQFGANGQGDFAKLIACAVPAVQ
jgi:hypothetical protein